MHRRGLYVVYVKQYCDSVDTFPALRKFALMLYLCQFLFSCFFEEGGVLKHLDQSVDSVPAPECITEQLWESIIFAFPWKSSVFLPFAVIFETPRCSVHSAASASDGREHKGAFSARWMVCTTHAALFSLRAGGFDARLLLSLARQG